MPPQGTGTRRESLHLDTEENDMGNLVGDLGESYGWEHSEEKEIEQSITENSMDVHKKN